MKKIFFSMWTSAFGWPPQPLSAAVCFWLTPLLPIRWPLSGFSFTDTDDSQDSTGREGTIFYSTLPLPRDHEHSEIYLQLCTWNDFHIFLFALLVFTRLLPDEIYHLIKLPFDWLIDWLIDDAMLIFLFIWWWFQVSVTAIWHRKPVDSNLRRLSPFYYKRTDQPSVLVTPNMCANTLKRALWNYVCVFFVMPHR